MKRISAAIMTACCFALAGTAGASGDSLALALHQIQADTEANIQSKIVDPILGKGNAYVFVDMSFDVVLKETGQSREGVGLLNKSVSTETVTRQGAEGKENSKGFSFGDEAEAAAKEAADKKQNAEEPLKAVAGLPERVEQSQTAQQGKKDLEQRMGAELEVKSFVLRILHNSDVSKEKLSLVNRTIMALYPKVVKGQTDMTIGWVSASFAQGNGTWIDKLAK